MSGITPVGTFWQSFYPYMTGTQYPLQIDANSAVMQRLAAQFAPSPTPDGGSMAVCVDPGHLFGAASLSEIGAWATGTINGTNQLVLTQPVSGFLNGMLIVAAATVPGGNGVIGAAAGIPDGTTVSSSSGLTITMSNSATLSGTVYVKICQVTSTITAPASGHTRTDRVCINALTGIIEYIAGSPVMSGTASPPAIPAGYLPCCQIFLADSTTVIGTAQLMDERDFSPTNAFLSQNDAGGFQNKFHNPRMDIFQRGASGTVTAGTPSIAADRWWLSCTGANMSWSSGFNGTVQANIINLSCASGITDAQIFQRIESTDAMVLGGQQVTVQATVWNATGASITPTLSAYYPTATDNWASETSILSAITLQPCPNNAVTKVAYTFACPSNVAAGLAIVVDFGGGLNHTAAGGVQLQLSNFDIRATPGVATGLNNAPPPVEIRPVALEKAICQRYLHVINQTNLGVVGYGISTSTTAFEIGIKLPVTMRAIPAATYPAASNFQANFITAATFTTSAADNSTVDIWTISGTVSSGLTSGGGAGVRWQNSTGNQIVLSAEL